MVSADMANIERCWNYPKVLWAEMGKGWIVLPALPAPLCPVAPEDGTGVAHVDGTGVKFRRTVKHISLGCLRVRDIDFCYYLTAQKAKSHPIQCPLESF